MFHEQLETYQFEGHPDKDLNGVSNMEVFAKAHSDITGLFANYAMVLQRLKTVDMNTKAEMKMMKSIVAVKCESYNEGMVGSIFVFHVSSLVFRKLQYFCLFVR